MQLVFVGNWNALLESNPSPLHLVIPSTFANLGYGETHGLELFGNWKVSGRWTLSPGYSFLTMHLHHSLSSNDLTTGPSTQGSSPNHQASALPFGSAQPLGMERIGLLCGTSLRAKCCFLYAPRFKPHMAACRKIFHRSGRRKSAQGSAHGIYGLRSNILPTMIKRSVYANSHGSFEDARN